MESRGVFSRDAPYGARRLGRPGDDPGRGWKRTISKSRTWAIPESRRPWQIKSYFYPTICMVGRSGRISYNNPVGQRRARGQIPIISVFFGIVIRMYHDEHPPAHFHATYQGFEAFIGIADGEIIHGRLPKKAARLVRQWALDHQAELMANWTRGETLEPMEMIPGADVDD